MSIVFRNVLLLGFNNNEDCQKAALGMESGAISDGQISASSNYGNFPPEQGRLHGSGSWGTNADIDQWLQVDLGDPNTNVTGVATQGIGDWDWVITYKLQYSNDEVNFHYYKEQGQNTDRVSPPIYLTNLFVLKFRYSHGHLIQFFGRGPTGKQFS